MHLAARALFLCTDTRGRTSLLLDRLITMVDMAKHSSSLSANHAWLMMAAIVSKEKPGMNSFLSSISAPTCLAT